EIAPAAFAAHLSKIFLKRGYTVSTEVDDAKWKDDLDGLRDKLCYELGDEDAEEAPSVTMTITMPEGEEDEEDGDDDDAAEPNKGETSQKEVESKPKSRKRKK